MSAQLLKRLLVVLAVAGSAAACGTKTKNQPLAPVSTSADLVRALDCRSGAGLDDADLALDGTATATATSTSTSTATSTAGSAALPQLRHVPAEDLVVQWKGASTSLCDLLRTANKPLALFQFVSDKCYDCLKWVDQVNADLASQGLAASVLSVPIVVDSPDELTDAEIQGLKTDVAPNATWVRDSDRSVWSFFSLTEDAAVSPLTVAMDWAARGFYCDQKQTSAATLVQLSDQLMGLSVGKK